MADVVWEFSTHSFRVSLEILPEDYDSKTLLPRGVRKPRTIPRATYDYLRKSYPAISKQHATTLAVDISVNHFGWCSPHPRVMTKVPA